MTRRRRAPRASGWLRAELNQPGSPLPPQRSPDPAGPPQVERARADYETGQAALATGRLAVAYTHFVVARGFAVGDDLLTADIVAAQGRVRLGQGNFGAARDAFCEALAHNPAHVGARVGLADLAMATYRPAAAIAPLYEALTLVPDPTRRAALHLALAGAHRRQRHSLLARPHLKMAARLGGVNLFVVAWCFLRTLAPWQWLVGAGGALVGGLALLQQGAGPLRSLATAVLTLTLLVGLLVLWAWQRTPTSSTGQGACLPTSSETSEDSDRASPATT